MQSVTGTVMAVLIGMLPVSAHACAEGWVDHPKPRQSVKDCSFSEFGAFGQWSGFPVRDLGGGKTGQRVVSSFTCPYQEVLAFVDCTAGTAVNVNGVLKPSIQAFVDRGGSVLGGDNLIKYIQPPFGPVGVTSESTVESVTASAKKGGYEWYSDILAEFARTNEEKRNWIGDGPEVIFDEFGQSERRIARYAKSKRANRPFDAYCGCKLYYPDSPGAMN
jgi:hypothetical protein